jgi:transcriptional regulator of heat shock response
MQYTLADGGATILVPQKDVYQLRLDLSAAGLPESGESGYELLDSYSIVAAPYATEDETVGVLGVIGPTRMAYERIIPIVDVTAKLLGRALKSSG